jgi:flagellar export protein FliJ
MFHFSLQNVLEVRERFEKIKYKEYSAELLVQQGLQGQLRTRVNSLRQSSSDIDRTKQVTRTPLPMQLFNQYRRRLNAEIELLEQQLREQGEAVEVKRKELVEARRSHRALEILREKEFKRYQKALERRERAVMDEVASNYHLYRQ